MRVTTMRAFARRRWSRQGTRPPPDPTMRILSLSSFARGVTPSTSRTNECVVEVGKKGGRPVQRGRIDVSQQGQRCGGRTTAIRLPAADNLQQQVLRGLERRSHFE